MTNPVDEQLEAYNRRDLDGFLEAYARGVRVEDGGGTVLMTGKTEMRPAYRTLFRDSPDLHCEVVTRINVGDWVFTEERITGMVAEGAPRRPHGVVAYRIKGKKIDFVRLYF